jgi:hypothetical protein
MEPFKSYSPDEPRPLRGYAALAFVFNGAVAAYAVSYARSGRKLPNRIPLSDLFLLAAGTYKLSRLLSKDKVTSFLRAPFTRYQGEEDRPTEISEQPRGSGLQRSIGQLLVCPYCLAQWVAAGFLATYLRQPRIARATAALFTIVAASDLLQQGWVAVDKRA